MPENCWLDVRAHPLPSLHMLELGAQDTFSIAQGKSFFPRSNIFRKDFFCSKFYDTDQFSPPLTQPPLCTLPPRKLPVMRENTHSSPSPVSYNLPSAVGGCMSCVHLPKKLCLFSLRKVGPTGEPRRSTKSPFLRL